MIEIPEFYRSLLVSACSATLSVISKDGSIQSTLVWPDYDGEYIKLNMLLGSPKEISISREKKATVLVTHGSNENLYISIRCELHEITHKGAIDHLNVTTQRNMGVSQWYGNVEPAEAESKNRRVVVYLKPVHLYHT